MSANEDEVAAAFAEELREQRRRARSGPLPAAIGDTIDTVQNAVDEAADTVEQAASDSSRSQESGDTSAGESGGSRQSGGPVETGGSGPPVTDAQQQNIDASLAEDVPSVQQAQQGVESGSGGVSDQAKQFEKQVVSERENLSTKDIKVTRGGDRLEATLTATGAEALGINPTRNERKARAAEAIAERNPSLNEEDINVNLDENGATATLSEQGRTERRTAAEFSESLRQVRQADGSSAEAVVGAVDDLVGRAGEARSEALQVASAALGARLSALTTSDESTQTPSSGSEAAGGRSATGVESQPGRVGDLARQLEQQVVAQNTNLTPAGVTVVQNGRQLRTRLTSQGEAALDQARTQQQRGIENAADAVAQDPTFSPVLSPSTSTFLRAARRTPQPVPDQPQDEQFGDFRLRVPENSPIAAGATLEGSVEQFGEAAGRTAGAAAEDAVEYLKSDASLSYGSPAARQLGAALLAEQSATGGRGQTTATIPSATLTAPVGGAVVSGGPQAGLATVQTPEATVPLEVNNEGPLERSLEGAAVGGARVPADVFLGAKEAGEFTVAGAQATVRGDGQQFAERTGAAAIQRGRRLAETAAADPFGVGGRLGGSAAVSGALIGGAAAVSPTLGRATAVGLQPGEELAISAARTAPRLSDIARSVPGVTRGQIEGRLGNRGSRADGDAASTDDFRLDDDSDPVVAVERNPDAAILQINTGGLRSGFRSGRQKARRANRDPEVLAAAVSPIGTRLQGAADRLTAFGDNLAEAPSRLRNAATPDGSVREVFPAVERPGRPDSPGGVDAEQAEQTLAAIGESAPAPGELPSVADDLLDRAVRRGAEAGRRSIASAAQDQFVAAGDILAGRSEADVPLPSRPGRPSAGLSLDFGVRDRVRQEVTAARFRAAELNRRPTELGRSLSGLSRGAVQEGTETLSDFGDLLADASLRIGRARARSDQPADDSLPDVDDDLLAGLDTDTTLFDDGAGGAGGGGTGDAGAGARQLATVGARGETETETVTETEEVAPDPARTGTGTDPVVRSVDGTARPRAEPSLSTDSSDLLGAATEPAVTADGTARPSVGPADATAIATDARGLGRLDLLSGTTLRFDLGSELRRGPQRTDLGDERVDTRGATSPLNLSLSITGRTTVTPIRGDVRAELFSETQQEQRQEPRGDIPRERRETPRAPADQDPTLGLSTPDFSPAGASAGGDGNLLPGFLAETVTDFALFPGQQSARSPSEAALSEAAESGAFEGELPTAELLNPTAEQAAAFEAIAPAFGLEGFR